MPVIRGKLAEGGESKRILPRCLKSLLSYSNVLKEFTVSVTEIESFYRTLKSFVYVFSWPYHIPTMIVPTTQPAPSTLLRI